MITRLYYVPTIKTEVTRPWTGQCEVNMFKMRYAANLNASLVDDVAFQKPITPLQDFQICRSTNTQQQNASLQGCRLLCQLGKIGSFKFEASIDQRRLFMHEISIRSRFRLSKTLHMSTMPLQTSLHLLEKSTCQTRMRIYKSTTMETLGMM